MQRRQITILISLPTLAARQYELLALLTILFGWQSSRLVARMTLGRLALLTLLTLAGMLTHFTFVIPVVGSVLYAAVKLRRRLRQTALMLSVVVAGILLAAVVHPWFFTAFQRQGGASTPFSMAAVAERSRQLLVTLIFQSHVLVAVILLLIFLVAARIVKQSDSRKRLGDWLPTGPIVLLVWNAAGTILPYLLLVTPGHASDFRHLALIWPYLFFLPVIILRACRVSPIRLAPMVVAPILFIPPLYFFLMVPTWLPDMRPSTELALSDPAALVLIDNRGRGQFLPLAWHLPNRATVIVANQSRLLADENEWIDYLNPGGIYFSKLGYSNSEEKRDEILALLQQHGFETPDFPLVGGAGRAYQLLNKNEVRLTANNK